ncbi:hypothetical protein CQ14_26025 [Bradyrhizobium lablabi]|uniref:Uncharacterized protein n=1 Tax=Bradyrhizobium lablabi TaxID=722472 RepID=A0A0R3MHT9_9BRAD|nr:hypothetical protein CQ14_26025 [Bradyrhizobium lablabi]
MRSEKSLRSDLLEHRSAFKRLLATILPLTLRLQTQFGACAAQNVTKRFERLVDGEQLATGTGLYAAPKKEIGLPLMRHG